jgi:hypothetical protein
MKCTAGLLKNMKLLSKELSMVDIKIRNQYHICIPITAETLLELVKNRLEAIKAESLPAKPPGATRHVSCLFSVDVPGGGDWSNTSLVIGEDVDCINLVLNVEDIKS